MTISLSKRSGENPVFSLDLSERLGAGVNVTGVTSIVADVAGLTIGTPTYSGQIINSQISGGIGAPVTTYKLVVTFSTATESARQAVVFLVVDDGLV